MKLPPTNTRYAAVVLCVITLLCIAFARRDIYFENIIKSSPLFNKQAPNGINTVNPIEEFYNLERQGKLDGLGARWDDLHNLPKPSIPPPTHSIKRSDYPKEWDWRQHANLHSNVLTQRAPNWCGACFAFAAMSSLTDRYLIHYPEKFNSILSVQEILNCAEDMGFGKIGCDGSQYEKVYSYVEKYGVVDSTCAPYMGTGRTHTVLHLDCPDYQCRSCTSDGSCGIIQNPKKWKIAGWGTVQGEDQMIAELYSRGPMACYIYTYVDSYINYKKGSILADPTVFKPGNITHVVELVGYGEEKGVPFWSFRNWAGTAAYDDGYFRVYRGNNTMNVEWNCGYAIPDPSL